MDADANRNLDERIRMRAYEIWQREGRPEGRADAHWAMASKLVAIENEDEFPASTDQGDEEAHPHRRTENNI